jgi:hypothetical protein
MIPSHTLMSLTSTANRLWDTASLTGARIAAIALTDAGELALLLDGSILTVITHEASCCENVTIPHVSCPSGTLETLVGADILRAVLRAPYSKEDADDWGTYADFVLTTAHGDTILTFRMEDECGFALHVRPARYRVDPIEAAAILTAPRRIAA